jgi:hypothetical protein
MTVSSESLFQQGDPDERAGVVSRRVVLRRSVFGVAGIGLASLLAACGGDDDEIEDPIGEEPAADDGAVDGADGAVEGADGAVDGADGAVEGADEAVDDEGDDA